MSPTTPSDPDQPENTADEPTGTGRDAAEEGAGATDTDAGAHEAAAAADPAGSEPAGDEATPQAEGTAAAETGVDKAAAEAVKPSPRRRDARRSADPGLEVRAQARYVRSSARKARLVCDQIRGKDVAQAQAILAFTPRAVARPWSKLLASAIANAEHNHELVSDDLRVVSVYADVGPTIKRFRPRAMGRATSIRKRTSHLTIVLGPKTGPNRKGGR